MAWLYIGAWFVVPLAWLYMKWANKQWETEVRALGHWYNNSRHWKCYQCKQPVWDNDDARVCIDCGGRNLRAAKPQEGA